MMMMMMTTTMTMIDPSISVQPLHMITHERKLDQECHYFVVCCKPAIKLQLGRSLFLMQVASPQSAH
jgi:hypothetical protein